MDSRLSRSTPNLLPRIHQEVEDSILSIGLHSLQMTPVLHAGIKPPRNKSKQLRQMHQQCLQRIHQINQVKRQNNDTITPD